MTKTKPRPEAQPSAEAEKPRVAKELQPGCEYVSDKQLAARYSTHRSTIWRWVGRGLLPKPIELSPGCTRWPLAEIQTLEALPLAQRQAAIAQRGAGEVEHRS